MYTARWRRYNKKQKPENVVPPLQTNSSIQTRRKKNKNKHKHKHKQHKQMQASKNIIPLKYDKKEFSKQ